jgi:hypothetical protein
MKNENEYTKVISQNIIDDTTITTYSNRTEYTVNGELHRDNDEPAVIFNDGTQAWFKNGKLYRDNSLPALIRHGKLYFQTGEIK